MTTTPRAATPTATPEPAATPAAAPAKSAKPATTAPRATKAKAAAAAKPAAAPAKEVKAKKPKLVRDSFTIPKDEYSAIEALKLRAGKKGYAAKKSELLRAGLKLLAGLSDADLLQALKAVPSLKTGRPKAEQTADAATQPAPKAKGSRK